MKFNKPVKKWAKDLNRHLNKDDIQIVNKDIKDTWHYVSSWNCELKQWNTIFHLLGWLKPTTLTTQYAGSNTEQHELSFIVMGMQNDTAILEDSLAGFYKTKHNFTMWSSNCAPLSFSQVSWKLMSTQKSAHEYL